MAREKVALARPAPDLRKRGGAATAATGIPALTCGVAPVAPARARTLNAALGHLRGGPRPATWHLIAAVPPAHGLTAGDVAASLALGLLAFAAYLVTCIIWPYGPCLACLGHRGRNPGSNSKRYGRCKACKGSGERLRPGTRLIRHWRGGRWP